MRIGCYVLGVAGRRGYERNVSGHVQIPLHSMRLLRQAGHEVELITTEFGAEQVMPACMPSGVPVHTLPYTYQNNDDGRSVHVEGRMLRPMAVLRHLRQLARIVRQRRFEVVHCFGHRRTLEVGGILRRLVSTPVVATLAGGELPAEAGWPWRWLWSGVDAVVSSTQYVANLGRAAGLNAHVVPHGILRDLRAELGGQTPAPRHRVLFWRDATMINGGDVCLAAFEVLSRQYPHLSFDLAIRPCSTEIPDVEAICRRCPNVHVWRFPYPPGISLAQLLAESICALLPFRLLSLDPQFATLETLAAGVPVVTTHIRSNPEFVIDGRNGLLVTPGDVPGTIQALRQMIENPEQAATMGRQAADDMAQHCRWDRYVSDLERVYQSVAG